MAYEDEIEQKISGRTYEECKEKWFNAYGKDFRITNKVVEWRPGGFLPLSKKPVTVVTYVVNHQKSYSPDSGRSFYSDKYSEEEQLAKNRDAILQSQSSVLITKQMSEMNNSLEELKNEMSRQLKNLAVSTQEKHESIQKIDEMLENNEFSLSFIRMIEEKIRNDFSLDQLDNFDLVERRVVDWIGESISVVKEMTFRPPHVFIIVGPTGVGKTKLSIELAKKLDAEIINGDSVAIYKKLDIGSAKPTVEEREGIPHHLIDIKDVEEEYSVFDYQKDVRKMIEEITSRNKRIIIVGGTGLYIKAALYDYKLVNEDFHSEFEELTNEEILNEIKKNYDTDIHINNRKRLVRELNKIKNNSTNISNINKPIYDIIVIGLTTDRDRLYKIIDNRVEQMVKDGLIREVKDLYDDKINTKAIETGIGYKELYKYFSGELSLNEALDLIKKNSRNFAKRQYTFFNHQMKVNWFNVDFDNFDNTINKVYEFITKEE